jgi:hypothetical protein
MNSNNVCLKEIIIQACPDLDKKDIDDFTKVNIIRNWAAGIITIADYDLLFDIYLNNWYTLNAYNIYQLFLNNKGGVWCAGASVFLKRIFEEFNYTAHYWSYGHASAFTHAVTLVSIKHNDSDILSIQDAFTDTTYTTDIGKPLDFFTLLNLLTERKDNMVKIVEPPGPFRRKMYKLSNTGSKDIITADNMDFTLESFFSERPWIIPATDNFLKKHGLPINYLYLHLFPLSIWEGPLEILDRARQITGWPPSIKTR